VDRSERLIKPGDSWFSSKAIEVAPRVITLGGRALCRLGGLYRLTKPMQTANTEKYSTGDTRRVIRSVVKRDTAQTDS
jgi:hypothetical protein